MVDITHTEPVKASLPKSDYPTIVLHWALLATLIFSFLTGMQVAADDPNSTWAHALRWMLPQGNVIVWHLISALGFVALVAGYTAFLWRAGALGRISLNRKWWKMLTASKDHRTRWRAVNTLVYWVGFIALIVALITGFLMDIVPGQNTYALSGLLHQYAAWALPLYILLHVSVLVIMAGWGHLLKLFRPRLAYTSAALTALGAGCAAAALLYATQSTVPGQSLQIIRTTDVPTLDGIADDPLWDDAHAVTVLTTRGENLPGGTVEVTLKAAHDGTHFYGLLQWPDTTRSQKHLPLVKTDRGWQVQQTEYGIQDEDVFYEDKFGVMLSNQGRIAGNHSIHMGNQPLAGKPGPSGGRGLHYTTDGSIVDVWHWKSVRTGNAVMGQLDDNYFGAPMTPEDGKRYTGGYTKDPKDGGGYEMNWEKYADSSVVPKYLPADPAMLDKFQTLDMSPDATDDVAVFLNKSDVVPYDPTLDTYPVGTIMPAVIVDKAMQGDRGDVQGVSHWHDGMWTIEIKRALDTGSEFDIAIAPDRPTYLWVAAFNHAQTRHSRHLYPIEMTLGN